VRILTGGGGGWGDPMARDPRTVARDARDGLLTAEAALAAHGVVLNPATGDADEPATALRRGAAR
jgi:N-methylhydantoinase B/oxoprolinase/acetone carboxylase alpha subunit